MSLHAQVELQLGDHALEVSLDVDDGEVVAVLGPNGAGKTTLLRALAGLLALRSGRVTLDGQTLEDPATGTRLPPEQRAIGVVFQDALLFPHLSALDNVAFGPRCHGAGKAAARRTAVRWLERMRLGDHLHARPATLSGGQTQRVALARALASDPSLLLLDEPMAALDIQARQSVRRELRRHLDAFAGPCVLVTHEPLEAIALADRLLIIEDGRVVQDAPAADVARRPRSDWVARLVGLNLYSGLARGHEVTLAGGSRLLSDDVGEGDVFAVVHPRAVGVYREQPHGSPRNTWPGTVAAIDLHGDHVRVHIDGALPIVAQITPAGLADLSLAEGAPAWVSVKATEVDLFPR